MENVKEIVVRKIDLGLPQPHPTSTKMSPSATFT